MVTKDAKSLLALTAVGSPIITLTGIPMSESIIEATLFAFDLDGHPVGFEWSAVKPDRGIDQSPRRE